MYYIENIYYSCYYVKIIQATLQLKWENYVDTKSPQNGAWMMNKWLGEGGGGSTSPLHHPHHHHAPYEGGGYASHLTGGGTTPNSYHGDTFVPAVVFNVRFLFLFLSLPPTVAALLMDIFIICSCFLLLFNIIFPKSVKLLILKWIDIRLIYLVMYIPNLCRIRILWI